MAEYGKCACGERLVLIGPDCWTHADNGLPAMVGCAYLGPWNVPRNWRTIMRQHGDAASARIAPREA